MGGSLPKLIDLAKLSCSFRLAIPIFVCLLLSLAWAGAKMVLAYRCDDHIWSLTAGCVEKAAMSPNVLDCTLLVKQWSSWGRNLEGEG